MEPPLPGYYQYFLGSKCALLKDTTRFDPSGARTPTSGSGIRGINRQAIALPSKAEVGNFEINKVSQTQNPFPPMLNQYRRNSIRQLFFFHFALGIVNLCVAEGRYQAKSNGPRCFMGYLYSHNFGISQIILFISQFRIKPYLLINEPQNLNSASLDALGSVIKSKQSTISNYTSRGTNQCYMTNTGKLPCISFFQTPYLDKICCFFKV